MRARPRSCNPRRDGTLSGPGQGDRSEVCDRRPHPGPRTCRKPGHLRGPAWVGTYVYEQALGPGAGGTQNFATHTLNVSGPDGDRRLVSFVSFGTGKVENKYGVKLYSVGQPLFAIAQAPNGLRTTWEGYAGALGDGPPSAAFKKVGR